MPNDTTRVIISRDFNFLAEGLLASLGKAPTWLFHVGKTNRQLHDFVRPAWMLHEEVIEKDADDGDILNQILVEKRWPKLVGDTKCLAFLDHGCLFVGERGFWAQLGMRLESGVLSGRCISATTPALRKGSWQPWSTQPAFAAAAQFGWPDSWKAKVVGNASLGIGQVITKALHETGQANKLDIFAGWPFKTLQWNRAYLAPVNRRPAAGTPAFTTLVSNYRSLMQSGHWRIRSETDSQRVEAIPLFRSAFGSDAATLR